MASAISGGRLAAKVLSVIVLPFLSLLALSACSPTPTSAMEGWWDNQRWADAGDGGGE